MLDEYLRQLEDASDVDADEAISAEIRAQATKGPALVVMGDGDELGRRGSAA